jgi:prolyl-tRNA synthetase
MRMSKLFSQTQRETPADAEVQSHQLLVRGGFILQLASGIFSYLPLARRVLTKIENIMREEIDAIGGQEITMPVVHPAEIWQETGRWFKIGTEMGRFKDKSGRDMVLAMTHEEVVADLVRKEIRSYRQLPALIYHIQTKWRDDPRPRAGLIRVREFTMKDSYSLDADWEGLDKQYRAHYQAYFNIFARCGLPVKAFKSDVGIMGGSMAHEFMYLTPIGEDTLLICDSCGYAANRQIARFHKERLPLEEPLPLKKVPTPGVQTIDALANFLDIPKSKTAKAVFLVASFPDDQQITDRLIFAILRGDMELNETKLVSVLKAKDLRPAREEEITKIGAVPGYASPIGLKDVFVVVDDLIPESSNLVAGANLAGYHLLNVNYGRDYTAQIVADIASAEEGSACPQCKSVMQSVRGIEVGNIFKLGTHFSESMGCYFNDEAGNLLPVIMGSYGIGSGRLMACIAEASHDEQGIIWPISVAPYSVHLVVLMSKEGRDVDAAQNPIAIADKIYTDLLKSGIEVLYDDRNESPGVKFNDADLIGIPLRLTVSERALNSGGIELKRRHEPAREIIELSLLMEKIQAEIDILENVIHSQVKPIPFQG